MDRARIVEVLHKAADVLELGGIIAGSRFDRAGRHCALGAIDAAVGFFPTNSYTMPITKALVEVLSLRPQMDRYNYGSKSNVDARVAAWSNNLVDAGKGHEVIAGFRRTATVLSQGEVK